MSAVGVPVLTSRVSSGFDPIEPPRPKPLTRPSWSSKIPAERANKSSRELSKLALNVPRRALEGESFPSLRGQKVQFGRMDIPVLVSAKGAELLARIVLPLDGRLNSLATNLYIGMSEQNLLLPLP